MLSFVHKHKSHLSDSLSMFFLRSIIGIVLILPLLFCGGGCTQKTNVPTPSSLEETSSFSVFLDDFFRTYVTSDSLSLHYTLLNPDRFQIEKPTVSFGRFSVESMHESNEISRAYLEKLHSFSRETLSAEEQLSYDLLEYALTHSAIPEGTELYDSPLGPTTGVQSQLPVLLAEYRFSSVEDVEDYFLLLEDLPNYFSQLCAFEQARSIAGTQACAEVLSRIILQCNSFVEDPDNNFLIESFQDRLSALPVLSATEKASFCMKNQTLVFTKVIPAYEKLIETLQALLDTSVPAKGLASFPDGSDYYEYLVRNNTGSDRSIHEIETMLSEALQKSMITMVSLYDSDTLRSQLDAYEEQGLPVSIGFTSPDYTTKGNTSLFSSSEYSSGLLTYLRSSIRTDFPTPADASFRVENVHPSLEDFLSPAMYLVPPFDHYNENVIYINRAKCSIESLFSTLAHEGYPGHLYQNTYFAASSPHPARMMLNFTGYEEGWGTYAELYAYRYTDSSEELQQFLIAEQVAGLCLYSLADLRIHYHGESMDSVISFLTTHGLSPESAQEVYYILLAEPGVYLPYSVGYLEFCSLRDLYLSLAGANASLLPFHTLLLETGPAPFSLLKDRVLTAFR